METLQIDKLKPDPSKLGITQEKLNQANKVILNVPRGIGLEKTIEYLMIEIADRAVLAYVIYEMAHQIGSDDVQRHYECN